MRFFWQKIKKSEPSNELNEILNAIRAKVEERKLLLDEMRLAYNPDKDKRESREWYFMHANYESTKFSLDYLREYQEKYKIQLPELIIRILNEIGSGKLLNRSFTDSKGGLNSPLYCFEIDFLKKCLDSGVSPKLIEDKMFDLYDLENNSFNNEEIQAIYESVNSNRDENIVILFANGDDSYLILNRDKKEKLAIFNITGICNQSIIIDGFEYDFPYYQYVGENSIGASFIQQLNTEYWRKPIFEAIKEMNKN
ncbi:MAG: hypothetical protein IT258_16490 [Saprospiraceae bacterium]|nr:hypothetical protein [Saprospiraceae bacterium]